MAKILVTRPIPDAGLRLLEDKGYKVDVLRVKMPPSQAQLVRALKNKGYDAILSVLTEKIDAKIFDAAGEGLKIVANYAVGFDNIDLDEAKRRGIYVTNAPGEEISESVADFAFTLMLAVARKVVEADKFTRLGKYKAWDPFLLLGQDVYKQTLGIIGSGRIGAALACRAHKGFGMKVVYNDIKPNPAFEKEFRAKFLPLDQLLQIADFVSLHVPLLPTTRHLIGAREMALMKKTAVLVNTARGPVVDENALVKALKAGVIAGAGLDVYEFEPRLAPGLAKLSNVILAPHIGSASLNTRQAMSRLAAMNIIAALSGQVPPNLAK